MISRPTPAPTYDGSTTSRPLPEALEGTESTPTRAAAVQERLTFGRWVRAARTGARWTIGLALGVWLNDLVLCSPTRDIVGWKRWTTGVGAALFVALTTAGALGAVAGVLGQALGRRFVGDVRDFGAAVRRGDREVGQSVAARSLALAVLAGAGGWVAYRVPLALELELSRPESIAGALMLTHLLFALAMVLAWSIVARVTRLAVDYASLVPGLRLITTRAWTVPALLLCLILGAVGVVLFERRHELDALGPWDRLAAIPAGLVGLALAAWWGRVRAPWARRAAAVVLVSCLAGALGAAAQLRPESTIARKLAFDQTTSGRLGYAVWKAALDFDGDGQLSVLGGGDCAPFDATRHIGAVEIAGNGIDEDCDGEDLSPVRFRPRALMPVGQGELPKRPNIVLVTIDALGAPRLAAMGSQSTPMPNLDRFAARSTLFTHAFAQGPSTRLSFPSMFTSRWDSQLTQLFAPHHPYPLAPFERQLQDLLNDAGYETVAVIPSTYFEPSYWPSVTRGFQRVDSSAVYRGKHNAPQVTDAALRALSSASDRPLYLWVHYYDAHAPYVPIAGESPVAPTDEALYQAELSLIDREVNRLLTAVEARSDATYLFLTADHATVFHPNPSTRKGHYGFDLYTATLHVPLLVHGPKISPGTVDSVVSTMDIAPTIADILHVPAPTYEGTSLLPEVLERKTDPDRLLFHEFYLAERDFRGEDPLSMVSVRNRHYNLVLDRVHGTYELYDWRNDYFEQRDLFDEAARSVEVLHLRSMLGAFVHQFHRRAPGTALLSAPGGGH